MSMLEGLDPKLGSESYVGHTSWCTVRIVSVDESCGSALYLYLCYGGGPSTFHKIEEFALISVRQILGILDLDLCLQAFMTIVVIYTPLTIIVPNTKTPQNKDPAHKKTHTQCGSNNKH